MNDDPNKGGGEFRYTKIEKPMDKPAKKYTANESVPEDSMNGEAVSEVFDNPGDLSKKFMR
jgi:hypothetical protein